jgi:hypothetical protein
MKIYQPSILRSGLLAGAALAICSIAQAQAQPRPTSGAPVAGRDYVPQEVMVKFRGGTSWALANGIHAKFGSTLLHNFNFIGWQRLRVPSRHQRRSRHRRNIDCRPMSRPSSRIMCGSHSRFPMIRALASSMH